MWSKKLFFLFENVEPWRLRHLHYNITFCPVISIRGLDIYIAILHSAQSFRFLYTSRKKNSLSSILLKGKLCETDTTVIEYIYFVINSNIKVCMISKKISIFYQDECQLLSWGENFVFMKIWKPCYNFFS